MAIEGKNTDVANWQDGVSLSEAWFHFASEYERNKFRNASSQGATEALQILMEAELFSKIESDELVAYGRLVSPSISDGPVKIPRHHFVGRPQNYNGADSKFVRSGWIYEDVAVCRIPSDPIANLSELPEAGSPKLARAGGRKDTYPYSAKVLEVLFQNPANQELSAENLHRAFKNEFAQMFPREVYMIEPPQPRTLRTQLKRFRQELATTGKN